MLDCNSVYANVERGLIDASDEVRQVYLDPAYRCIVEALILDDDTPEGVYRDLLGWSLDEVKSYRSYFFSVPEGTPRLPKYKLIDSFPMVTSGDIMRRDLFLGVFNHGWEYVDTLYNRGHRISVSARVIDSLRKMFGKIDKMVLDCMDNPNVANTQNIMRLLKAALELENKGKPQDASTEFALSFVEKIQEEGRKRSMDSSKIMNMNFDELSRVKPVKEGSAEQTRLDEIFEDIKLAQDKED